MIDNIRNHYPLTRPSTVYRHKRGFLKAGADRIAIAMLAGFYCGFSGLRVNEALRAV
jgi:hypothetical protein